MAAYVTRCPRINLGGLTEPLAFMGDASQDEVLIIMITVMIIRTLNSLGNSVVVFNRVNNDCVSTGSVIPR